MAITKVSPDVLNLDSGITITTADNSDTLTLTSTDTDANAAPYLNFYRNPGEAGADSDQLGQITFVGKNDAGTPEDVDYARIITQIKDASDGTEDGRLAINTMVGGSVYSRMNVLEGETVFNDESIDVDFRIEGNGQANLFVVNAGTDDIGIGMASPTFATGNGMQFADDFYLGFGTGNGTRPDFSIHGDNNGLDFACGTGADTADITFNTSGNIIAPQLNQTGSTSNRYPLYWVHTGTVGSLEPYTGSVRAMKTDIADMGSVNWIHSLTPRSFKFRDYTTDSEGNRTYLETTDDLPNTEYGLIAEEVDEVSGSDYILDKDADDNVKGVLYHNLVPILLKSIQELKTELDAAKARITTLEG